MFFKLHIIYHWIKLTLRGSFKNRAALEQYQQRKLEQFARSVLFKSNFYRQYFREGSFRWSLVMQMHKDSFMEHFNAINTCGLDKEMAMNLALSSEKSRSFKQELNGITVGLSTGTSGKRGLFLVSQDERAQWVALVMTRIIEPKLFRKQKIAFFLRANSNLYTSIASNLFEFRYFDIFRPMDKLIAELSAYSPDILAAPPSILVDIAKAQQAAKINLQLHQLLSFAEVLHSHDKTQIIEAFKAPLREVYQCTEGLLGISCKHGTMHLNEDIIYVEKEWIDDTKFYPIITDFTRSTQPVVKYKMNDILEIRTSPCPCGSAMLAIEKIIGRDEDVLVFNHKKIYPDLLMRRLAIYAAEVNDFQITQVANNELLVAIDTQASNYQEACKSFESTITDLAKELGIEDLQFRFEPNVIRQVGSKQRKIIRSI